MKKPKFTTTELAKDDPLIRLAIVENDIAHLNRKIESFQSQITDLNVHKSFE